MSLPPVMLYGIQGCKECLKARHFLTEEGIPHAIIAADPITDCGARLMDAKLVSKGSEEGTQMFEVSDKAAYPRAWVPLLKRVIRGWNQEEYEQIADAYNRERRRRALDFTAAQSGHPEQAPQPAEAGSSASTAAGVPPLSRVVGSNGNVSDGELVAATD